MKCTKIVIPAAEKSINVSQLSEFKQQIEKLNDSSMTGHIIQDAINSSLSNLNTNLDAKNATIDLCQTCQSGIGGVGEAAEKIKSLALGNIKINSTCSRTGLL